MQSPGKGRSFLLWSGSALRWRKGAFLLLFLLSAAAGWIVGEQWPEATLPGGGPLQAATCGDNFVDPSSESCDDGNAVSNDGCSSTCQIECSAPSDCPVNQPVSPCYNPGAPPWLRNFLSGQCISNACEWEAQNCNTEAGLCTDGVDNDGDSSTDCADSNCAGDAACVCDNDGTAESGETCSNCPYDVRCSATQKCIAGVCTASTGCEREDICGDGWVSGFEKCDDGGICKGSLNLSYEGENCFDIDPTGNNLAGVARCRATGGRCIAQGNDGCAAHCQDECHPTDSPCLIDADCCSPETCVNGRCGTPPVCGNSIIESPETCDDGCLAGTPGVCELADDGDACTSTCTSVTSCPGTPACSTSHCATFGNTWEVTASGITDGVCTSCGGFNVTAESISINTGPPYCNDNCEWCWAGGSNACSMAFAWHLAYYAKEGRWKLTVGGGMAYYVLNDSEWNCSGPNVMKLLGSTSDCGNWPATITVTPVGTRSCS